MTRLRPIHFNGKFYGGGLNGVHRVADRLIRECDARLAELPEAQRPPACVLTPESADWVPDLTVIERRSFPVTGQLWEQAVLPVRARGGVLVNLANLAPVAHRRKITMIHDAQFLFGDCGYPWRQRVGYRWLAPLIGRTSRTVLTVSDFSRRMLDTFAIADAAKVRVIHNGADHIIEAAENPALRQRLGLVPNGYAVIFGSPKRYKNVETAFAAFADGALAPLRLVVVGPDRAAHEAVGIHPPADAIFAGRPDDGELRGLLASALVTLFPSRTEGFGLPPLEAMLCGCPVIAAPAGAIPEACGNAALYAGTDSPAEWRAAIKALRDDPVLRGRMIAQGYRRASGFTWSRAGAELMETILDVARQD